MCHPNGMPAISRGSRERTRRTLKTQPAFPRFESWQDGYGAFTISDREKQGVIEYIKGQEEHHRRESFLDEYRRMLTEHGIEFDERYLA